MTGPGPPSSPAAPLLLRRTEPAVAAPDGRGGLRVAGRGVLLVKRAIDFAVSAIALIAVSWLLLLIAVAIKLDSPGPVLYVQQRVGRGGRIFRFLKFRSMYEDADARRTELLAENQATGPIFKLREDPRITPVGRWLRRSSLDELPQLVNVLLGDMSLVGPRPPLPCEVMEYDAREWRRLGVTPGLTCTWQVSGRSDLDFETWMRLDLDYIERWSLWLDLKLMISTIPAVLTGRGAY